MLSIFSSAMLLSARFDVHAPTALLLLALVIGNSRILSASNVTGEESGEESKTLTLGLLVSFLGNQFASAIIPAIAEVERRQLLPGYKIDWDWRLSWCNANTGNILPNLLSNDWKTY